MSADIKIKRADLRRQRSETALATRRRDADTPMKQLGVEWDRVLQRAKRADNPDAAIGWLVEEIRKLGDRL